jgi:FkbM family methyltransferase
LDLDFIIDIGANIGISTTYIKGLFPKAKIIALEPEPYTFECLKKNTRFIRDIFIEQKAYGDGGKCNTNKRDNGFLGIYTTNNNDGTVESLTMEDIFIKYELSDDSKYFIKSDCEGSEKYFINNVFCENVILKSQLFFCEIHFKSAKTPMFEIEWQTFDSWIRDNFSKTHNIDYFVSNKHRGYGHFLLSKFQKIPLL